MNELIKLNEQTIDTKLVQTVNARELHAFLEVSTAFKDWISRRVKDYDFKENLDFCSFLSESSGGRPSKEYHITLDMAKELSMVERNDKGKEARRYFIECEKQLKNTVSTKDSFLLGIMKAESEVDRAVAINAYEIGYVKPLEEKLVLQAPKVSFHDNVLKAETLYTITQIANDYPITNQRLNKILEQKGVQYKDKSGIWTIKAEYTDKGLAQTETHTYDRGEGRVGSKQYLKWTQKGRLFIYNLLKEMGILPIVESEGKDKNA